MSMNRRTFLSRITQLCSLAISFLLGLPVFRFLRSSAAEQERSGWYPVIEADELTEEIMQVTFSRVIREGWLTRTAKDYVWIRRKPDGSLVVFEPHCTHLGCAYAWNEDARQFHCPCHGGKFDMEGNRLAGPPPRPLDRFEVKVEGKLLKIGKVVKA